MYRLELMGVPFPATTAERSTSVSTTMPRSARDALTARTPAAIAALSSGLGTWLGNQPSGSRYWLPAPTPAGCSQSRRPLLSTRISCQLVSSAEARGVHSDALDPAAITKDPEEQAPIFSREFPETRSRSQAVNLRSE